MGPKFTRAHRAFDSSFPLILLFLTLFNNNCRSPERISAYSKRTAQTGEQQKDNYNDPSGETSSDQAGEKPSSPNQPAAKADSCGDIAAFGSSGSEAGLNIVGGTVVDSSDLVMRSTVKLYPMGCTGTLINKNLILTAAHCFTGAPQNFVQGITIGFGSAGTVDNSLQATGVMIHPKFNTQISPPYPNVALYDVALIAFSGKVPSPYKPVVVASLQDQIEVGSTITLAGYGAYFNGDQNFNRPLTSIQIKIGQLLNQFREIQLVQGGKIGGCNGDSGGPSYFTSADKSCLKVISTTSGPGRGVTDNCATGSGTLQDARLYHGWIKCSAAKLMQPLNYLQDDSSAADCATSQPVLR